MRIDHFRSAWVSCVLRVIAAGSCIVVAYAFHNAEGRDKDWPTARVGSGCALTSAAVPEHPMLPFSEPAIGEIPLPIVAPWHQGLDSIPVEQSDLIVIGRVTHATAVVCQQRVGSDFTIRVTSVLKAPPDQHLTAGSTIVLARAGGVLEFRDGRSFLFSYVGQHAPAAVGEYMLFSRRSGSVCALLAAFRLSDDRVIALDGVRSSRSRPVLPLSAHDGADRNSFMEVVNQKLQLGRSR